MDIKILDDRIKSKKKLGTIFMNCMLSQSHLAAFTATDHNGTTVAIILLPSTNA